MKNFNKFFSKNNTFTFNNFTHSFRNSKNSFFKTSKHFFSNQIKTPSTASYAALAIAVGGLGFLSLRNFTSVAAHTKVLLSTEQNRSQATVTQRTRDTVLYFCGGLGLTAGLTTVMARSRLLTHSLNPWTMLLTIPALLFFSYKVQTTPSTSPTKSLHFLGFNSCIAFSLVPLSAFIPVVVLRDAALLTCGLMTGLGVVSVGAKDDSFANWSGVLGAGLGAMMALSIASIFIRSPVVHSVWLYGGLVLFMGMTLYDIKQVQIRAKKSGHFDPMAESIHVYLDFINMFVRLAMIMNNRKK